MSQRLHSLYQEISEYPPDGFEYINTEQSKISSTLVSSIDRFLLQKVKQASLLEPLIEYLVAIANITYEKTRGDIESKDADLIYSSQHLVFRDKPWIVDLEYATALVSYGRFGILKKEVESTLASDNCKKIIPYTQASKISLLKSLNCSNFIEKIEVVPLAVCSKNFIKTYDEDKIKLLFVGSGNSWNVHNDFLLKGGNIVLTAFLSLCKGYDNLELIIRSKVPDYVKTVQKKHDNITIIDHVVSETELASIFSTADIFLLPTHATPGMVLLDAMSYELPIITTDLWANNEMVSDGYNGLLINPSEDKYYVRDNHIPNWGTAKFLKSLNTIDPKMVQSLIDRTQYLIDNETLRKKMGQNGRKLIDHGRFSNTQRNRKLKRIFHNALS